MEWSGVEWRGVEWSGVEWSGVERRGVERSGVGVQKQWRLHTWWVRTRLARRVLKMSRPSPLCTANAKERHQKRKHRTRESMCSWKQWQDTKQHWLLGHKEGRAKEKKKEQKEKETHRMRFCDARFISHCILRRSSATAASRCLQMGNEHQDMVVHNDVCACVCVCVRVCVCGDTRQGCAQ